MNVHTVVSWTETDYVQAFKMFLPIDHFKNTVIPVWSECQTVLFEDQGSHLREKNCVFYSIKEQAMQI